MDTPSEPKGPQYAQISASGKAADELIKALGGVKKITPEGEFDVPPMKLKVCSFSYMGDENSKSIRLDVLSIGDKEVEGDEEESDDEEEEAEDEEASKGPHRNPAVNRMKKKLGKPEKSGGY